MRQELTTDTVERYIEASPEALYDLIADVTRTPERTPDIVRSSGSTAPPARPWAPASSPLNKAHVRGPNWSNKPVWSPCRPRPGVLVHRTEPFGGTLLWRHRFEPEGTGTRVIESYEVTKPVSRFGWFIIDTLFGAKDRRGRPPREHAHHPRPPGGADRAHDRGVGRQLS